MTNYNEAISGDLSNDFANPTVIGLTNGSNRIEGSTTIEDQDFFSFEIPDGFAVTEIVLTDYQWDNGDQSDKKEYGRSYFALTQGSSFPGNEKNNGPKYDDSGFEVSKLIDNRTTDNYTSEVGLNLLDSNVGDIAGSPLVTINQLNPGVYSIWYQETGANTTYEFDVVLSPTAVPQISVNDITLAEGDSGNSEFTFTVSLDQASTQTVSVDLTTADGTAIAPQDYTATTGILYFAPGETEKTFTVEVIGDSEIEPDETFSVNLSNPSNAAISKGVGTGTILTDDQDSTIKHNEATSGDLANDSLNPTVVQLTSGSNLIKGSTTNNPLDLDFFSFEIPDGFVVSEIVLTDYQWGDGDQSNAAYGKSYFALTKGSQFASTSDASSFDISKLIDNNTGDSEVGFNLLDSNVGDTTGSPLGTNNQLNPGVYSIWYQETGANTSYEFDLVLSPTAVPQISVDDVTLAEGDSGNSEFTFTVSLDQASTQTVTVDYTTADDSAIASQDYTAMVGTLSFAPGETAKNITVQVIGDTEIEPDETFTVNLGNPSNAAISKAVGTGTILTDDQVVPINYSPQQLDFAIDFASLNNQLLQLQQAWIYDENGSSDLVKIDFWLLSPDGSWNNISDAEQFNPWSGDARWASFNYQLNLDQYSPGNYGLWAQGYDTANNYSNSVIKSFTIPDTINNPPTNFSFQIEYSTYTDIETLQLDDGWVFDADGTDDLASVDMWVLRHSDNQWIDLADITGFTSWSGDDRWASFDYQIDLWQYQPSDYTLWGQVYDESGQTSNSYNIDFTVLSSQYNSAPEQLQFRLNQYSYSQGDTVTIEDAWLYDADGADDITLVDFWLQKLDGTWHELDDATSFTAWPVDNNWASFDYQFSLAGYEPGIYEVWAEAYDSYGEFSNLAVTSFMIEDSSAIAL